MAVDEMDYEEDYFDDETLDREMIDAGSYIGRWTSFDIEMDDGPVLVYALFPVVPACESDDLLLIDSDGHSFDSSVMRRSQAVELFSRDPYTFALQNSELDKQRSYLSRVAVEQMQYFLRHGFRGIHLSDFSYITGFADRSVPNSFS